MKTKKILIVAESIDVEDSSGSKANVALIDSLHQLGFQLRVYHYTRKDVELKSVPCFALRENRKSLLFFLSRIERQLRYKFNVSLNRYVEGFFGFSFTHLNDKNSIIEGLNQVDDFSPDLVLTLSKGSSFRPHHALLKLPQWHDRWMAYIHDPYPMHSYPRPYDWVEPGHQKKRNFFLDVATKAKYAAYPSKLLGEWMESYYPPLKGKAVIIPHQSASEEEIFAESSPYLDPHKFSVVHSGTLLEARNPLSMVEAFIQFIGRNPEAKEMSLLLFLGPRSCYQEKLERLQEGCPQLYVSEDYVPFSEVITVMKTASVNVVLESKGPISPFLPGKFPHCISAGRPILLLGPFFSESRRLLGEDYPWWSSIDDVDRICQIIEELYFEWLDNKGILEFKRQDLFHYLGPQHLSGIMESILGE